MMKQTDFYTRKYDQADWLRAAEESYWMSVRRAERAAQPSPPAPKSQSRLWTLFHNLRHPRALLHIKHHPAHR